MPKARILVVDDEAATRSGLERLLQDSEYEVITASNGEEALARAATFVPDVVVTDVRMPKMDGLTLLRELRARDPDQLVVVLTAADEATSAEDVTGQAPSEHVTKPVEIDRLLLVLERLLGQRATWGARPPAASSAERQPRPAARAPFTR